MDDRVITIKPAVELPDEDYIKCVCLGPGGETLIANWVEPLGEWVDCVGVTYAPHKDVTQWFKVPRWL